MPDQDAWTRLVDEAAIRDATARFADAATRGDAQALRALWAPGARWRIGDHVDATGVDAIAETFGQLRDGREFFVQFAVQGPITITGGRAQAATICHEQVRGPGGGYYRNHCTTEDHLARQPSGAWLFTARRFRYLWLDTSPFGGQSFPVSRCISGPSTRS